ncbi:breast carcinoma-amplified sequence 1 [Rhinophrynus dorsalis]
MGNEMSRLEEEENMSEKDPEYAVVQNGSVTLQSTPRVNAMQETDRVDGKQVVQKENVITSSQKTIVISPISNGGDNKPPLPAEKSKFKLTISRPAPGLTTFQANGAKVVSANPEVTSGEPIVVQKGTPVVLEATLPTKSAGGNQNQSPPSVSGTNESSVVISTSNEVETTPSKPKEISIFDKLFRPEKRVQIEVPVEPQAEENQEMITVEQNSGLQSVPPSNNLQVQKVDDFKQTAVEVQSSERASLPASQDQNYSEITLRATQTSPQEEIHPVMSFFKTLVSPNKSVPKSEEEPKNEVDDKKKENGGLRKSSSKKEKAKNVSQQAAAAEGLNKQGSPKTSTLSRLFRQKSKKEEQQTSGGNVVVEQPVVAVTITSEPPAPGQILTQDTKPTEPNIQLQITEQASKDDRKAAKESTPRPRPFWRKSFKGDPPSPKPQEKSLKEEMQEPQLTDNVVVEQPVVSVTVNSEKSAPDQILTLDSKPTEPNVQTQIKAPAANDEGKAAKEPPQRPMPFWRKSFKGDPLPPKTQTKSLKEELQEPQLTDNVVVEQPVVSVTVNSEKFAPDQILTLDSKPTEPNVQPQIKAPALNDEGKAAKERPMPFWRKSFKGDPLPPKTQTKSLKEELQEPQLTDNVVLEQPVASVTVNSEKSTPEQILTLNTKSTEPNVQPQIIAQASNNDGMAAKEPPQRPMPFWRKSFKGDPSPLKNKENVVVEQPVVTLTVNSEKSAPEQILTLDTKPTEPNVQPQITAQASNNDGISAKEPPQWPRPFWRKSFKGDPPPSKTQEKSLKEELQESQLTDNVVVEQPVVSVTLNSEKSAPDQILTLGTNTNDSTAQPLITAQASNDEGNVANESSPRPMPFWRKSFRGTPQPVMVQENSLKEEPQSVQLTEDASAEPDAQTAKADADAKAAASSGKGQELQDKSKKPEDGKNAKPKLMMFFKQLTVIGDGGNARSEEVNEKTTDQSTLDVTDGTEASKTEKTVVTAVVEPPVAQAQKSKETPKEKKAAADKITKQESKESVEVVIAAPQQVVDPAMVQNGGDMSKDGQLKRTEKRQSLGSFFKAIGPKRMCDAEVQTDPVSILPADKVK